MCEVPQLYNLKDYKSFFRGSSKYSIEEVINIKSKARSENPNVEDERIALHPFTLSQEQRKELVDFLTNALYDPSMARYQPDKVLSGYCFPNNDAMSRTDMGCQ